jgi:hypothetical protein
MTLETWNMEAISDGRNLAAVPVPVATSANLTDEIRRFLLLEIFV